MRIEQFNHLDAEDAADRLRACAAIDPWVDAVVAARPYGTRDELLTHAMSLAAGWTAGDVEAALADHPRIGEQHPGGPGERTAEQSAREQAGIDPADAEVRARLAAGNHAYEERFGRIFLVRAAGRSAAEILALLEERLAHDDATEVKVVADQLAEIALLRLEGLLS